VCEPIFGKPIKDISFGFFLMQLFQITRRFNMPVQPQLVLLQKTLLTIEGIGRELYPELDLWTTAKPVLEEWMRERKDPRVQLKRLVDSWPAVSEDLLLVPEILHRAIRRAAAQSPEAAATRPRSVTPARRRGRAYAHADRFFAYGDRKGPDREPFAPARLRSDRLFVGAAFLLGGVLWSGLEAAPLWIGWLAAALGAVLLLAAALRRDRR
jgi:ubiquinone biosynthesis protein